ncbi:unnamed protein product [Timema podura]|uniref:Uncharacterized protein n=1 Tax=Timema podura TaxID=61482 RepID=A0ABN7NP13_TIMPD|nr:unnamed protein product [Timema podura]
MSLQLQHCRCGSSRKHSWLHQCCDTSRYRLVSQMNLKLRMREECDSSRIRRSLVARYRRGQTSPRTANGRLRIPASCEGRHASTRPPRGAPERELGSHPHRLKSRYKTLHTSCPFWSKATLLSDGTPGSNKHPV